MASTSSAVFCALVALVFWTALGYPIVRRLLSPALALPFAPLAGWALHSVVALPIFFFVPFSATTIALVAALGLGIAWAVPRDDATERDPSRISPWALLAAAILALACAAAILPKQVGDAVILSDQIFDHAKISMVNDMARLGLPPGNPYFAHDGGSGRLSYYYLLHFSSAELTRLLHVSGWEADIAMTFFAAFTSLAAMMALAVKFSGRASASLWVVAIAASSSSRLLLDWVVGGPALDAWFESPGGFGGWMFQAPWVPQHLISTSCVLLAVLLMSRLATRPNVAATLVLALVAAAAFESSTWVGGIVFALVAVVVVPLLFFHIERSSRLRFVIALAVTALVTIALVSPFLIDQVASSRLRHTGFPIALRLSGVLGPSVPEAWRAWLDGPAYWLLLLPVAMSAAYLPGIAMVVRTLTGRNALASRMLAVVALVSLTIAWLLVSTIADNNDLGWRAALLGASALTVFAAMGLARWTAEGRRVVVALAIGALLIGLPESWLQVHRNFAGHDQPHGHFFAQMPAMWQKVREHSAIDERVVNNPRGFKDMTPWPVNIAWSLLADRRSCYAGWELAQVFTAVPHDRLRTIDALFVRVFAGDGTPDDVKQMATAYDCSLAVVTSQDGAWTRDPFATSPFFALVDEDAARWRIYRRR